MRYLIVILILSLSTLLMASPILGFEAGHFNSIPNTSNRNLYYDGITIKYLQPTSQKLSSGAGLTFALIESRSSQEFLENSIDLFLKFSYITAYESSPEKIFSIRFSFAGGFSVIGFKQTGTFLSLTPGLAFNLNNLSFAFNFGIETQILAGNTLGLWSVSMETTYSF